MTMSVRGPKAPPQPKAAKQPKKGEEPKGSRHLDPAGEAPALTKKDEATFEYRPGLVKRALLAAEGRIKRSATQLRKGGKDAAKFSAKTASAAVINDVARGAYGEAMGTFLDENHWLVRNSLEPSASGDGNPNASKGTSDH